MKDNLIIEALKDLLNEDFEDEEESEEPEEYIEDWDEKVLYPALKEIEQEKEIPLDCESNGNSGEILTIWSNDEDVSWEESIYNFEDDDDWDEDEDAGYSSLNIENPEENYKTKDELKEYILSMIIIKQHACDYCGSTENVHYDPEEGYVCDQCLANWKNEIPTDDYDYNEPRKEFDGLSLKDFVFEVDSLEDWAKMAGVPLKPESYEAIADTMWEAIYESTGEDVPTEVLLKLIKDVADIK